MSDILSKGALFPEELLPGLINKVRGHSSLAALCGSTPVPFNGMKEFTFSFDNEVDIVAENGAKSKGGATVDPVTIVPVKIEYGTRASDEFLYASESVQLNTLSSFAEGFSKKAARGLDIMAFHGLNPRTRTPSAVIGDNHFNRKVTQVVTKTADSNADTEMDDAIALIEGSEHDVTGAAFAPAFRSELAKLTGQNGQRLYPDLAWGRNPGNINGLKVDVNSTVSFNQSLNRAIVGDFENMFQWGYAKEIPIEIIRYGNPDNDATLGDLKGHNQIYIRAEMYIGWGILDASAFAWIKAAT